MFRLEPHVIENLITCAAESKNIRGRYAVRQLVSREMERERIRRRRGGIHVPFIFILSCSLGRLFYCLLFFVYSFSFVCISFPYYLCLYVLMIDLPEVVPEKKGVKRSIDQVEGAKKIVERVKKDFFGRVIVELAEETQEGETKRRRTESSNALKIQPDVWVRFHEGYSNAVRKPVAFMDLLSGKGL